MQNNTRDEENNVYASKGHAFALVARVVAGFVLEAGFVFVFDPGALVAVLTALSAAALAAGCRKGHHPRVPKQDFALTFLASVFLLEVFFGFVAAEVFFVMAFFEETLGVAAFLTVGFEVAFVLDFFGATVFLDFSTVALVVAFELSAADFFAVVLLGFSPVEDGFLVVVTLFLVEAGFLF